MRKVTKLLTVFALLMTMFSVSAFISPAVHAAETHTTMPDSCIGSSCNGQYVNGSGCTGTVLETSASVYDSYNHLEGYIRLHYSTSCVTFWGTFASNNNTWQHVTVNTVSGFVGGGGYSSVLYGYYPYANYDAPMLFTRCATASVDLIDNRGIDNYQVTSQACTG